MILETAESARYLPAGALIFKSDGEVISVAIDEYYVLAAAKFLIDKGFKQDVGTQADLVAEAVNHFGWGLGASNYVAFANSNLP